MQVVKQIFTSRETVVLSAGNHPALLAITNLFEALHEHDIVYCNLKGNDQHLRIFMTGESDIDVLFDQNQKEKLELVLHTLGFKRFEAIKQKQYKDIVDFIALDPASGKVIHLHTYYRLTIGEPYLKGYQLDIENQILKTRVFNKSFGTYCIQPVFELILLYLTEALKLRHRDWVMMYLMNKGSFREKVTYEHNWLRKKTKDSEIESVLQSLFKDYIPIHNLIKGEFNRKQFHKLAPLIKNEFERYRLYSHLGGLLQRWYRETTVVIFRKLSRIVDRPVLSMRVNPRGGIVVAVTGCDSALNSTITNQLKETFGRKLDVYKIKFGRHADRNSLELQNPEESERFLSSVRNGIRAIMTARKENRFLKLALTAKKKKALVICDYLPPNQDMGYRDGAILHDLLHSKNPFLRSLARIESSIHEKSEKFLPDLVFTLTPDNEWTGQIELHEISRENQNYEITTGIRKPRVINKCKTIKVDAGKPLTDVLYIIKNEIWNIL